MDANEASRVVWATVRVIPIEGEAVAGTCVRCGKPSAREVYFAQAY